MIGVIDLFRADAHVSNLRIAAFETLMELIKNSPKDCYEVVQKTTLVVLKKLEQLLNMENSVESSSHKVYLVLDHFCFILFFFVLSRFFPSLP